MWTFSIYLEAVAILPQLFLVSKTGEAESITSHYLFALGSYRALYLLNWVYRYYMEGFHDWIAITAGVVQTILYCDFFYLYVTRGTSAPAAACLSACEHLLTRSCASDEGPRTQATSLKHLDRCCCGVIYTQSCRAARPRNKEGESEDGLQWLVFGSCWVWIE